MNTHSHTEAQYRIIGRRQDGSIIISWFDTFDGALKQAERFSESRIFRPDGTFIGAYFTQARANHV